MLLQFTFDIFYSHRFMSNSFIYFTVAVSAGALHCGTGAPAHPRGAAVQLDVLPGPQQWQAPRSPPKGTELSRDLVGETGASVTLRLIKHQEDFG